MTFARALTNPWVRERAVRVRDLLAPRVRSVRFWALLLLGLLLAGALWIAVTAWFARGELMPVHDAAAAARTAAAPGDLPAPTDHAPERLTPHANQRRHDLATRGALLREARIDGAVHGPRRPLVRPPAFASSGRERG